MHGQIQKELTQLLKFKFTDKDIKKLQDASHKQDYNEVKEILLNYGVTSKDINQDINKIKEIVDAVDSEIANAERLQRKKEQDFNRFKKIMKLHKLYLENNPLGVIADIKGLNLSGRDLSEYNFCRAQIEDTDLSDCYLYGVNFSRAYLENVNFTNANLEGVNLSRTNLYNVNFTNAILTNANLPRYANYYMVDNKINFDNSFKRRLGVCLNKPIIGWKKCYLRMYNHFPSNEVLVKLEIPRGAIVFSINDDKCRTNMAKVLDIVSLDGKKEYKLAYADYKLFRYHVGEELFEPNFNCQYNVECAEGIHFFRNKRRAISYEG